MGDSKPSSAGFAAGGATSRPLTARDMRQNPNVQRSRPASADWTRGNEVHMEGREPFEVWRSGLHSQIASLEKQMTAVEDDYDQYEEELEENRPKDAGGEEAMVRKPLQVPAPSKAGKEDKQASSNS